MSALVKGGFDAWRECRQEYDLDLYARYVRAEVAINGRMLNARGMARGIDPISLFMGPAIRAHAYASEELIEHWETDPRVPFAEFERQWMQNRDALEGPWS